MNRSKILATFTVPVSLFFGWLSLFFFSSLRLYQILDEINANFIANPATEIGTYMRIAAVYDDASGVSWFSVIITAVLLGLLYAVLNNIRGQKTAVWQIALISGGLMAIAIILMFAVHTFFLAFVIPPLIESMTNNLEIGQQVAEQLRWSVNQTFPTQELTLLVVGFVLSAITSALAYGRPNPFKK